MSYEMINKKLQVYACNVVDITEKGIKNLPVFTNGGRRVILNKDHQDFDSNKKLVFSYMESSSSRREQLKNTLTNNHFASCIDLLDKAIEASTIDINTSEGWNEYVRQGNIKALARMGIEVTDDNLRSYQDEVNRQVEELTRYLPEHSVPMVYRN